MERIIVKLDGNQEEMLDWLHVTQDGDLMDMDVLNHGSTFILNAVGAQTKSMAYLPVQQPLMLENLIFKPGLTNSQRAAAITKMAEHAVSEAYRRDAGELYFLCRDAETSAFAERHHFKLLPSELKVYRLNLLETFGS